MSENESTEHDLLTEDEARRYARRIQAEIGADADRRRREDPDLAREEREIERAWARVAPVGAAGNNEELLLDRVDRLSMIDVDAPLGARPGVRQVKGAIRKGTYWYLRYISDQLNALHSVQSRLLRRLDDRIARVERSVDLGPSLEDLLGAAPAPSRAVGAAAALSLRDAPGPVVVLTCGAGEAVAGLVDAGVVAHGLDPDPAAVVAGADAGLDLRIADPIESLTAADAGSLGGIVLGGFVERLTAAEILVVFDASLVALAGDGVLVVAVDDPTERTGAVRELAAGRGLSPSVWGLIAEHRGCRVEFVALEDDRVSAVLIARLA